MKKEGGTLTLRRWTSEPSDALYTSTSVPTAATSCPTARPASACAPRPHGIAHRESAHLRAQRGEERDTPRVGSCGMRRGALPEDSNNDPHSCLLSASVLRPAQGEVRSFPVRQDA
jgi:hypothetical protein